MITQDTVTIFDEGAGAWPQVTVIVPLYNYERHVEQTLISLLDQSLDSFGLLVVNDASKDRSEATAERWMEQFHRRFARCMLVRNIRNAGLSITRNTGIALSGSDYLFFLDADNMVYPRCLERHAQVLDASPAAGAAYALIEVFGSEAAIMGAEVFQRERLKHGNYVDAMAMVRRSTLAALGGYHDVKYGWEDYDLWLRMCESDMYAIQIPEVLSRYRVHDRSMLRTVTNIDDNHLRLRDDIVRRHPWLELG